MRNRNPAWKTGELNSLCNLVVGVSYPLHNYILDVWFLIQSRITPTFKRISFIVHAEMTNLGPLTTTYTATGADCQSTYLAANNDNQWIQYGQPDTTQCVPPKFTAFQQYYYSPGICPSGYYYACEAGVGTSSTQATCCPT